MLLVYKYFFLFLLCTLPVLDASLRLTPNNREIILFVNKSYMTVCSDANGDLTNWINPQGRLIPFNHGQPHLEMTENGTAIVFEAVSTNHRGLYTCINAKTNERIVFDLQIFTPISFYNTRSVQTIAEGEDGLITCFAHGDPKPEISWQALGKDLKPPKFLITTRGLSISKINVYDGGIYTCKATQISTKLSDFQIKTIHVKVLHEPKRSSSKSIYAKVEPVFGLLGTLINLTCTAVAEPPAKFSWFRDNNEILSPRSVINEEHASILQIRITTPFVFGDYVCKATNSYGTLEQVFALQEGLALPPPKEIQLEELSNISAVLKVIEPEIRNRQIPITMRLNGFRFEIRSNESIDYQTIDFYSTKNSLYKITNLDNKTTYEIRVASLNAAGAGNFSDLFVFATSQANATIFGNALHQFMFILNFMLLIVHFNYK